METGKNIKTNLTQHESVPKTEPTTEHLWLQKLVGHWKFEGEAIMGLDNPPAKLTGTESVRSLGDIWIQAEGKGQCPVSGGDETTIVTLGYDPVKKRYVGSFIGSMMTFLWVYDGELNSAGNVLTLNSEGPSFADEEKIAKYRDIIEIKDDNHRVLSSKVLADDGKWHQIMKINYYKTKLSDSGNQ